MRHRRGAALLAVLWLSAILTAIAFSVATTVRGETERTSTLSEGVRAYYLATGALERALAYIEWGPNHRKPDNTPRYFEPGMARLNFNFPSGSRRSRSFPKSSKFDINSIKPDELQRLLMNLGADPARAQLIAAAIVDWRQPAPPGTFSPCSISSIFRAFRLSGRRHASVEETEELLLVKGMTPELYHGSYVRDAAGRLQPRAGLKDCVSVYGSSGSIRYQFGATRRTDHHRNQPRCGRRDPAAASCHAFSKRRGISAVRAIRRTWFRQADFGWQYDLYASIHGAAPRWGRAVLGHDAHGQRDLQVSQVRVHPWDRGFALV